MTGRVVKVSVSRGGVPKAAVAAAFFGGLDRRAVVPGARLLLEAASCVTPCAATVRCFEGSDFGRVSHESHPGSARVHARVLAPREVRPGDPVELVRRPCPGAARATVLFHAARMSGAATRGFVRYTP